MNNKKKLLCWSDCATAGTGFGVVSRHVIRSLYDTGRYEIHQLAINSHGDFVDKAMVPWDMQPAKLLDPNDPHGLKMFYRSMLKTDYDVVWVLNDLFVTHQVGEAIEKIKERATSRGIKPPVFVHYYPVDCHVLPEVSSFLDQADVNVCYTKHGREETVKVKPYLGKKLIEIPHGVDASVYKPAPRSIRNIWKSQYFGVSPDTTIVISVNRNSPRKDIPYSILAFKEFKKKIPNSLLYVHTMAKDPQGYDLNRVLADLDLDSKTDVIFPGKYSPANPTSDEMLNRLYNCADMFLTTHLGEGWGLTITEAMAAGLPVIAPRNTCMPQQLGEHSERGYMYECKDSMWIDSSGFRPKGLIPDIVAQMMAAYTDAQTRQTERTDKALEWARLHDWKNVTSKWVELFQNAENVVIDKDVVIEEV